MFTLKILKLWFMFTIGRTFFGNLKKISGFSAIQFREISFDLEKKSISDWRGHHFIFLFSACSNPLRNSLKTRIESTKMASQCTDVHRFPSRLTMSLKKKSECNQIKCKRCVDVVDLDFVTPTSSFHNKFHIKRKVCAKSRVSFLYCV